MTLPSPAPLSGQAVPVSVQIALPKVELHHRQGIYRGVWLLGVASKTVAEEESAMYMFPTESTAMLNGCTPSATVVITPFETLRMFPFSLSAMYRFPAESTATPVGINPALVAGPLSPLKLTLPFPATVVSSPVLTSNRWTILSWGLTKNKLPARSTAIPDT